MWQITQYGREIDRKPYHEHLSVAREVIALQMDTTCPLTCGPGEESGTILVAGSVRLQTPYIPFGIRSQSHPARGTLCALGGPLPVSPGPSSSSFLHCQVYPWKPRSFFNMSLLLQVLTISGKDLSGENKINIKSVLFPFLLPPASPAFTSVLFLSFRYSSCFEHVLSVS